MPVAIKWGHNLAVAFMMDQKLGLVLAKDVTLKDGEYGLSVVFGPKTMRYPIVNPESIVTNYVIRFAYGEVNL